MANIIEISKLNPLRVIWQANKLAQDSGTIHYQAFHPAFNSKDFDSAFFYDSIRYYEEKSGYCQLWQQSDSILFQFMSNDATNTHFNCQLLDKNGELYRTIGYPTAISGTYDGLKAYRVSIPLYNVDEGTYFFRIVYTASSEQVLLISEPFNVKQIQPKTIRIDYWNSFNDFSYVFESGYVMQYRVRGCVTEIRPDSKFNVYEDQPLNTEMVSGIAFRTYLAQFGLGFRGIPEWELDRLERIFLCDTVKVENHAVTREAGAKLDVKLSDGLPFGTATLKLRERYNTDTYNVADFTKIVGDMPQTSYFFIGVMTINGASTAVQKVFSGKRNFLDYLNATHLVTKGYWSENANNKLIFTLYEGQTVSTNTLTAANTLSYVVKFRCYGTGDLKVSYSESIVATTYMALVDDLTTITNLTTYSGSLSTTKSYTGGWHNYYFCFSDLTTIADNTTTGSVIKYIEGDLPPGLTTFTFSTAVGLLAIGNNMFKYVTALTSFNINGNSLSTYMVDELLRYLYDSRSHLDATCNITLTQTPAAPPSRDMLQFKALIDAVTGTITTD